MQILKNGMMPTPMKFTCFGCECVFLVHPEDFTEKPYLYHMLDSGCDYTVSARCPMCEERLSNEYPKSEYVFKENVGTSGRMYQRAIGDAL